MTLKPSQPPEKPLRHFIGDGRRRANEGEPAEAAGDLGELSHR
jgi:hypothetical protein